jgi:two-component system NtrC family response regulator
MTKSQILIVEDDLDWLEIYQRILQGVSYEIMTARNVNTALKLLGEIPFDVVITDLKMLGFEGEFSGFGVLEQAKFLNPNVQVIVITGYGSADHALRAMGSGAYDYITKDRDLRKKLVLSVQGALEANALKKELLNREQQDDSHIGFDRILGNSASMQSLFEKISITADSNVNVLINGEPGTGKRLIAETIHRHSHRRKGSFMVVDCGRLSDAVLESELFGYEAGTLYSSDEVRAGKFERAKRGTVFLESIGDLDIGLQTRLIGVICDRVVERVGGLEPVNLDVRIIASTDKDLATLAEERKFERRLFHALNEFVINVPPLRDRKDGDDIPALAAMFAQRYSEEGTIIFADEVVELLRNYDYPGNVQELESAVKYALTMAKGTYIEKQHLRPEIRTYAPYKRGKPNGFTDKKDPNTIVRVCPLNLGSCSKRDEILRLYTQQRVFVNVSCEKRYEEYERTIRLTLEDYGLAPVLPKDYLEPGMLMCNICKLIQSCKYGITDISALGSNVLYELGLMHAIGVPCAILKEYRAELTADIQGLLFLEYDSVETLSKSLSRWIERYVPEAELSSKPSSFDSKNSAGLRPFVNASLIETLIACGPFTDDQALRALFVDARISPWRNQLSQSSTPISRVRMVIELLHDQYNDRQENALALFLQVLCDQTDSNTRCFGQLIQLADELKPRMK